MRRLGLDWVWWIPARGNPLKAPPSEFGARLSAVQVLLNRHPRMRVSDVEQRTGLTYTVDLVRLLKRKCPNAHFVWLMGADSLAGFHRWRNWQALAEEIPIVAVARPGEGPAARFSPFARRFAAARLPERFAARLPDRDLPAWTYLKAPLNSMSSTRLRRQSQKR